MIHFHARVPTASASLYLLKLCKHFRHKVAVTFDARRADARFPFGHCLMRAEAGWLGFDCTVEDEAACQRMQFVIADHLLRFSRDPGLRVTWRAGPMA